MARASAFQAEGRGFESRFPLHVFSWDVLYRPCSSVVERFLGKEEAIGSIPIMGFTFDGSVCDRVNFTFSPGSFGRLGWRYVFLVNENAGYCSFGVRRLQAAELFYHKE